MKVDKLIVALKYFENKVFPILDGQYDVMCTQDCTRIIITLIGNNVTQIEGIGKLDAYKSAEYDKWRALL